MKVKRPLRWVAAAALAIASFGVGPVAPAEAATANAGVYGIVPKWGGWVCPGWANALVDVRYSNHTTGRNGGDGGDDIVWVPVRLGITNHITMSAKCRWGTYMSMNYRVVPNRNGQAIWFNLNGTHSKN